MAGRVLDRAVLGLALLPLAMTAANLPLFRRPGRAAGRPAVSVLVPARNEEDNIGDCVRAVLASTEVALELVVLDDDSTDRTGAVLATIGDPRLRVIRGDGAPPPGWCGKQYACDRLGRAARAPLLVFIDADVRLAPDALSRLAGFLQRHPTVDLCSGVPKQWTEGWSERLLLPLIQFLLLGYRPEWADRGRAAPPLAAGCGQLMACRRDAWFSVGGHGRVRGSMHDGLTLPRAFRRAGLRTALVDATALASCRMYRSVGELWSGLGKNATEGMATPRALPVWTLLLGLGHVLPLPLAVFTQRPAPVLALGAGIGLRLALALRFEQSVAGALAHPVGVFLLLLRQWTALRDARAGRAATWRGRAVAMQGVAVRNGPSGGSAAA
ncbi:MAG: glycosyltransferase [Gluconacetobacter diazotrophicus]|nr:glycosyltransferase [Gluconacetobacter diazotrophicus]